MSGTVRVGEHDYKKPVHRCMHCGEPCPLIPRPGWPCTSCFEGVNFTDLSGQVLN